MIYVEAPNEAPPGWRSHTSVFLAGGITGCPDWQAEMTERLDPHDLVVMNPRRADFPMGDPDAARAQIEWEYNFLRFADMILFWFPAETICPIALFELGAWSMTTKPILVGAHPNYPRLQDVQIQMSLVRPEIIVSSTVAELAAATARLAERQS